ncbi:MAG TPA: hypothetical protein VMI54_02815 [Polyangiaceae bacterium]|nr:hypothetical protein [Polyangiaceae bacterium]
MKRGRVVTAPGLGLAAAFSAVLVALPAGAAGPSRAEDPNYDPDAEARATERARTAPYGGRGSQTGETDPYATNQEADETPYLEADALRKQIPDLALNAWPPPTRLTFALVQLYPFQLAGLGVGMETYAAKILRLSAFFSVGFAEGGTPDAGELLFSTYGEASVGLRVLAFDGSIAAHIDAADSKPKELWTKSRPLFDAWLPGTHAFLLEAGMFTGVVPRARCLEHCTDGDFEQTVYRSVNPQLFYLEGGLRYVFFSQAYSHSMPLADRVWQIEAFFRLVNRPFNDARGAFVSLNDDHIPMSPFGARGGVVFPVCGHDCIRVSFTGGYLPSPDTATFSAGISY